MFVGLMGAFLASNTASAQQMLKNEPAAGRNARR
jgi:hypothetical protein